MIKLALLAAAACGAAADATFPSVASRNFVPPVAAPTTFSISASLGDNMVLQRAPQAATVWGFAAPGTTVKTTFLGDVYTSTAGADTIWRQALPPQPATTTPATITFTASTGESGSLSNVLFGDVFFCSGQSST
jgi:hypothetical protein